MFGIFENLGLNGIVGEEESSIWVSLLTSFYQLASGVGLGLVFGFIFGWIFKLLRLNNWFKAALCMTVLSLILAFAKILEFNQTKYIGIIVFGYILHCIWGKSKPEKQLKGVWIGLKPILFGAVGASI